MSEVSYSMALRCIGQDLERRGAHVFSIKRDGGHFVVSPAAQGMAHAPAEPLRYTPADLEMIDRCGESQRGTHRTEEFFHAAQMLRVIGEHLDKYGSTLISVSCNRLAPTEAPFTVEYITREGEHVIDDRPGTAIFDECVLMFQKRRATAAVPSVGRP
jgi:hypothetical protein